MKYILLFFYLISYQYLQAQITAQEILQRTDAVMYRHSTISYDITQQVKYFSNSDTNFSQARCYLKYDATTKKKLYHHIEEYVGYYPPRYKQIYNGDSIVNISVGDTSALIIRTRQKESKGFMYERHIPDFIRHNMLKGGYFTKFITSETVTDVVVREDMYNNTACYVINITNIVGKKNETDDYNTTIFIDKATYLPQGLVSTVGFQDMTQYMAIAISNLKLNPVLNPQLFEIDHNLTTTTVRRYYDPKTYGKTSVQQVVKGVSAPAINLKTTIGEDFDLSAYKGKTVLLDFWYIGCYPCLVAIPDLQKIATNYDTSKVVLIGINIRDEKDKIASFLEKRNITYTNVYNGLAIAQAFEVSIFPTLYIIDKHGKIYAKHEGWPIVKNKSLFKKLYLKNLHAKIKKSMKV